MTARVLVVEDVDANVKLLEARLTADYFEVRTARSGREALEICANERADVVLLDVMMPGMDGFEVLPQAQGRDAHPAHSSDHGDRARSASGQGEGVRGEGRRLPHQACRRCRSGQAGEESRAVEDADRRDVDARFDRGTVGFRRRLA